MAKAYMFKGTKLFISNLDYLVTDSDISELFSELGSIIEATVHYNRWGLSLRTAHVIYMRPEDARKAMKVFQGFFLGAYPLTITTISSPAGDFHSSTRLPVKMRLSAAPNRPFAGLKRLSRGPKTIPIQMTRQNARFPVLQRGKKRLGNRPSRLFVTNKTISIADHQSESVNEAMDSRLPSVLELDNQLDEYHQAGKKIPIKPANEIDEISDIDLVTENFESLELLSNHIPSSVEDLTSSVLEPAGEEITAFNNLYKGMKSPGTISVEKYPVKLKIAEKKRASLETVEEISDKRGTDEESEMDFLSILQNSRNKSDDLKLVLEGLDDTADEIPEVLEDVTIKISGFLGETGKVVLDPDIVQEVTEKVSKEFDKFNSKTLDKIAEVANSSDKLEAPTKPEMLSTKIVDRLKHFTDAVLDNIGSSSNIADGSIDFTKVSSEPEDAIKITNEPKDGPVPHCPGGLEENPETLSADGLSHCSDGLEEIPETLSADSLSHCPGRLEVMPETLSADSLSHCPGGQEEIPETLSADSLSHCPGGLQEIPETLSADRLSHCPGGLQEIPETLSADSLSHCPGGLEEIPETLSADSLSHCPGGLEVMPETLSADSLSHCPGGLEEIPETLAADSLSHCPGGLEVMAETVSIASEETTIKASDGLNASQKKVQLMEERKLIESTPRKEVDKVGRKVGRKPKTDEDKKMTEENKENVQNKITKLKRKNHPRRSTRLTPRK